MSPPGLALLGATNVTFSASGSDPGGGTLSYEWNFGDGATASGQSVSHVFAQEGSLSVRLTLRSSRGTSTDVTNTASVRGVAGAWVDGDPNFEIEFTQGQGGTCGGRVFVQGKYVSDIQNCRLTHPRNISFHRQWNGKGFYGVYSGDYDGTVNDTITKIHAESIPGVSFDLTRK
jgi:hypothetical protein